MTIGESAPRVGGRGRVNGEQQYVADIHLPNELHVTLVTLPVARARIQSVDPTRALNLPGVAAVFSAADLPRPMPRFGPQFDDRPVIAIDEVKYHGDPVAAVAAESKDAAEEAAALVDVDFEELPAVTTIDVALAQDAPLVQDSSRRPGDPLANTNVLRQHLIEWGDLESESARAHLVVEHSYRFPMVTQFAIEPHAFMAAPDSDGVTVWSSIQHPYWLQRIIAKVLGLPLSKVRIIAPDPGGAFGGKQHAKYEPLLAFMALKAQRPMRLVLSLEESFLAARRTSTEIRVRTGVARDGTFVFQDIDANYLIGAYADIADRVVGKGSYIGNGPYNWPAARINARSILSHTVPSTAMRGFGNPQINWAVESNITEAAIELGLDQVDIRMRNLANRDDAFIPFDTPADGDWADSVNRAVELIGWNEPKPAGRGRGIALGIKSGPTTGLSYSMVRLLADGSAVVYAGTQDIGQGARTIFAQICANELGLPIERVSVVMGDTAVVPYDQQTSASRSTVLMGNAVLRAAQDVKAKLADRGVDSALDVRDALGRLGGEIVGLGEARKEADPNHPLGGSAAFFEFNATAVELSVDEETGDITIHRHVAVSDVGKSLNKLQVQMQDEGAAIMGLGHTLMEQYIWDEDGRIRNLGAIDYRIPTSMDLPQEMISDTIENEDGPGPYGAKGMSEGAVLAAASAVAAAVRDATGVAIRDLPLSPENVWRALRDGGRATD
ncbi:MAG TPA: xanthine dehydrogenase family protein molybdopterin-binding subunit [Candidatus Limnocylindrales bacterium]|nr:xanthine dehydrogenase family protein molybdopterin-binding subunit [Candidatus Limnocylindrales bacterium]